MGTVADPTREFLAQLEDSTRFAVKRGVPIWCAHTREHKNADGTVTKIVVTEDDLPVYAANIQALTDNRGVVGRITDGHLRTDLPESQQPPLLGFFRNARVGTFGAKNIPAVLVDCYYRRDRLNIVADRPNRSPEVYPKSKEIRGLALLIREPYLDMGNVTFDRDELPICYGAEHMPEAAMGPNNAPAPDHTPEEAALFEKCVKYMRMKYALGDEWPGSPTEEKPEAKAEEPKDEVTAMSKGETPVDYAKQIADMRADFERKLMAEKARTDGIQLERDQERCLTMMTQLCEVEHYKLTDDERKRELAKLVKLPAAERPERVQELRAIYSDRKAPEGMLQLYAGPVEGGETDAIHGAPWYHEAAMEYMRRDANIGMSYEAACQHIQDTASKR